MGADAFQQARNFLAKALGTRNCLSLITRMSDASRALYSSRSCIAYYFSADLSSAKSFKRKKKKLAQRRNFRHTSPPASKAFGAVTPEQREGGLCVSQFIPELGHSLQSCESTRRIRVGGTAWRSLLHERSPEDLCRSKKEGEYKMPTARPMNVEVDDITLKWRRRLSSKQGIS